MAFTLIKSSSQLSSRMSHILDTSFTDCIIYMLFSNFRQDEARDNDWNISKRRQQRTDRQDHKRRKSMRSHFQGLTLKPHNWLEELHNTLAGNKSLGSQMRQPGTSTWSKSSGLQGHQDKAWRVTGTRVVRKYCSHSWHSHSYLSTNKGIIKKGTWSRIQTWRENLKYGCHTGLL